MISSTQSGHSSVAAARYSTAGSTGYCTDWKACAISVEQMAGRIAASESDHAPANLRGDGRGWQQIAREVDDVLEIIAVAEPVNRETRDGAAFFLVEPDRPADSGSRQESSRSGGVG